MGKRIKAERLVKGWSQEQLAKESGISQSTIAGLEGERNPGSARVAQIAAALGVNPLWLATGKGEKHPEQLEVIAIWSDLDEERKSRLLATARDLRTAQATAKNPFPHLPNPKTGNQ